MILYGGSPHILVHQYVATTKTNIQMMVKSMLFRNQYSILYTRYTQTHHFCVESRKSRHMESMNTHTHTHMSMGFDFFTAANEKQKIKININGIQRILLLVIYLPEHYTSDCIHAYEHIHAYRVYNVHVHVQCGTNFVIAVR